MITALKRLVDMVGRREYFFTAVCTAAVYLLIERLALFRPEPASLREVLHALPMRVTSLYCAGYAFAALASPVRDRSPVRARAGASLYHLSLLVLVAALWTSVYTRFEGTAIRTENTVFNAFRQDYVPQTLFLAKHAELPQVGIRVTKVRPVPSEDMQRIRTIHADIQYAGRTTPGILPGTLGSSWPLVSDWTLVTLTDFGYAAEYTLFDLRKQPLESNAVFMNLFPAGAEDYFETRFLGYIFYLKLYPEAVESDGHYRTRSVEPKDPLYSLRIVRHKDIVYHGPLRPGKRLQFDNVVISLGEPRMWVEMRFVRDLGIPVALAGFLLMAAAIVLLITGAGKGRQELSKHGT